MSALLLQGVLKSVQAIFGAALIFFFDRTLLATCRKNGIKLPTAPAGMLLVFFSMMVLHSIDPNTASKVLDWFGPARKFYSKFVPLFLSPPIVQLPLTLGVLPLPTVLKYLALILMGTVVSIISTGLAANALVAATLATGRNNTAGGKGAVMRLQGGSGSSTESTGGSCATRSKPRRSTSHLKIKHKTGTGSVLKMAVVGMFLFAAIRKESLFIASASLAALQLGQALPIKVRAVCPAIIPCGVLTAMVVAFVGKMRGQEAAAALRAYKDGRGGIFGGNGIGDLLFCGAAPAIVTMGFSLYEQRDLLLQNLAPLLGGSTVAAAISVAFTILMAKAINLEKEVGLSLLPRFLSMSMAVPVVEAFGANLGLAAAALVLQGILGSAVGKEILDFIGIQDEVAKGVAMGGTAHTLATASLSLTDPQLSPPCAITLLLTGTVACALVQSDAVCRTIASVLD